MFTQYFDVVLNICWLKKRTDFTSTTNNELKEVCVRESASCVSSYFTSQTKIYLKNTHTYKYTHSTTHTHPHTHSHMQKRDGCFVRVQYMISLSLSLSLSLSFSTLSSRGHKSPRQKVGDRGTTVKKFRDLKNHPNSWKMILCSHSVQLFQLYFLSRFFIVIWHEHNKDMK